LSEYSDQTRSIAKTLATLANRAQRLAKGVGYGLAATRALEKGALLLFAAWGIEELGNEAQRIADDPPDPHYDSNTYPRPRRIRGENLGLIPEDDESRWALSVAEQSDIAAAVLAAHRRAFERFQTASTVDPSSIHSRRRASEAVDYAHQAGYELDRLRERVRAFGQALAADADLPLRESPGTPRRLPDKTLALLYLGGLPLGTLERLVDQPVRDPPRDAVEELAPAIQALAVEMRKWDLPARDTDT